MNNKIQITQKGLDSLKTELEELQNNKRPKLVERLSDARAAGDLSENSDYHNARDELEFLDGRIEELEEVLKNAEIVNESASGNQVSVGTLVVVKVNGSQHEYQIVGEWEADPMKKKISHTSPLGQALVGRSIGESVEVEAPVGKISYTVLDIK